MTYTEIMLEALRVSARNGETEQTDLNNTITAVFAIAGKED